MLFFFSVSRFPLHTQLQARRCSWARHCRTPRAAEVAPGHTDFHIAAAQVCTDGGGSSLRAYGRLHKRRTKLIRNYMRGLVQELGGAWRKQHMGWP